MIRTLPNQPEDKIKDWSGTNPCYIRYEAMEFLVKKGIEHFMIDTPSVDREEDEGKLLAHKAFWNYPSDLPRLDATITEMIYAPDDIQDGLYIVNIQTLPLAMDASPSNILLYKVKE
jgi:kynurenine formamidase